MPKGISKPRINWGIDVSKHNPITRKVMYRPNGLIEKTKVLIRNVHFKNGEPQPLYFPMDHQYQNLQGKFKGMAVILQEQGFGDMTKVPALCLNFKCKPGEVWCYCHWILYSQLNFAEAESFLETTCRSQGIHVIFLPKFHCELNFIEQYWGRGKSIYRTYPPSSREEDLEMNTLQALASIPLL